MYLFNLLHFKTLLNMVELNMDTKIENDVLMLKPTDEKLRKTVQGFKLVNLKCNKAEIALISGMSERTIHTKNQIIDEFWSKGSHSPDDDKNFIIESVIAIQIAELNSESTTLGHALGVILGTYLKVETDLLDKAESLKKVWTIGQYIANIHSKVCSYKNKDDGVPIHSTNDVYAKYILNSKNMDKLSLDKLFLRSDDYEIGKYSKRWLSTELLIKYIDISSNKLLDIISNTNNCESIFSCSSSFVSHMLHQKGAIQGTVQGNVNINMLRQKGAIQGTCQNSANNNKKRKPFFKLNHDYVFGILTVKIDILKQFDTNSKFILLKHTSELIKDELWVSMKHRGKSSEYLGRAYNVFCSLHPHERLQLSYISYDMSAAMQSISLQLINGTKDDYPMLWVCQR